MKAIDRTIGRVVLSASGLIFDNVPQKGFPDFVRSSIGSTIRSQVSLYEPRRAVIADI